MHNVKLKVNLNKKVANLTNSILSNANFAMQESAKHSCKSIYKNFNFNSKTKCADGDEMHFTAQMYNKYYSGRLCMLTFKNNAFVSMYTLD
jgi:hypothetical protein